MPNQWYIATLIMRCKVGAHDPGPWTFEEQIRMVAALDVETAYAESLALGKVEEHAYYYSCSSSASPAAEAAGYPLRRRPTPAHLGRGSGLRAASRGLEPHGVRGFQKPYSAKYNCNTLRMSIMRWSSGSLLACRISKR
jgi:hypothetical protein